MILTCTRYSKWASGQEFNKDDEVAIGKIAIGNIITDKMAEDMLRCNYAVKKDAKPHIETKKEVAKEEVSIPESTEKVIKDSVRKSKKVKKEIKET